MLIDSQNSNILFLFSNKTVILFGMTTSPVKRLDFCSFPELRCSCITKFFHIKCKEKHCLWLLIILPFPLFLPLVCLELKQSPLKMRGCLKCLWACQQWSPQTSPELSISGFDFTRKYNPLFLSQFYLVCFMHTTRSNPK